MLKTNSNQKGFTIVELLIVIVIIGILGLLVLNTVTGAQARARDSERQSDVNALATQLEVRYNEEGGYPLLSQITDVASAKALFPGIDGNALGAPGGTGFDLVAGPSSDIRQYGYETPGCTVADQCDSFILTYVKEQDDSVQTKNSLNN